MLACGRVVTELDAPDADSLLAAGRPGALAVPSLAARGVRASAVRLALVVHSQVKRGFAGQLVDVARERGVSGYVGDGSNRWPAAHVLDIATLFRLALQQTPPGSELHGWTGGRPSLDIAEVIGRHLDLQAVSVHAEQRPSTSAGSGPSSPSTPPAWNTLTRELLDWQATHPRLLKDMEKDHFSHPRLTSPKARVLGLAELQSANPRQ